MIVTFLDNIDYDNIKQLIKEHTTPSKVKAISIPGQGNETEVHFESLLYSLFQEQHERIGLFVKSKLGEIKRRLGKWFRLKGVNGMLILLKSRKC
jgi:hypothetical protein